MSAFRYLAIQVLAYGLDMGTFISIMYFDASQPLLVNMAGKVVAGVFAFFGHRSFTFNAARDTPMRQQGVLYVLLLLFNLPLASIVLWLILLADLPVTLGKFIADGICVGLNYVLSRKLVFSGSAAQQVDVAPPTRDSR